jgi:hypothetical protein
LLWANCCDAFDANARAYRNVGRIERTHLQDPRL